MEKGGEVKTALIWSHGDGDGDGRMELLLHNLLYIVPLLLIFPLICILGGNVKYVLDLEDRGFWDYYFLVCYLGIILPAIPLAVYIILSLVAHLFFIICACTGRGDRVRDWGRNNRYVTDCLSFFGGRCYRRVFGIEEDALV